MFMQLKEINRIGNQQEKDRAYFWEWDNNQNKWLGDKSTQLGK